MYVHAGAFACARFVVEPERVNENRPRSVDFFEYDAGRSARPSPSAPAADAARTVPASCSRRAYVGDAENTERRRTGIEWKSKTEWRLVLLLRLLLVLRLVLALDPSPPSPPPPPPLAKASLAVCQVCRFASRARSLGSAVTVTRGVRRSSPGSLCTRWRRD